MKHTNIGTNELKRCDYCSLAIAVHLIVQLEKWSIEYISALFVRYDVE